MRENRRVFFLTLALSLTVLFSALALVLVDARGRSMTLGDPAPPVERVLTPAGEVLLEIHAFGWNKTVKITEFDRFFSFLLDFSCIPHK